MTLVREGLVNHENFEWEYLVLLKNLPLLSTHLMN